MKIGIDATALISAHPTGVEVVTRDLLRALLEQDQNNQYIFYAPNPLPEAWSKFANLTNRVLPAQRFWIVNQLTPAVRQDSLDVFWSPSNILPFALPTKALATIHDLATIYFPKAYSWKTRLLSWLTITRAIRFASKILVVSEQTKIDLLAKFSLPTERVVVIPNALPRLTQPNNDPVPFAQYLLIVGRVEARKNPITAIKAFAMIAAQYPKLQLVFAGGFGYQAELAKQLAQTIGLADRIHFLGFVKDVELANLYLHASAVLFPSLYEGFGLPILEAFHYGVPVVASNTPAVAEVAGDAALLVNPTDALELSQKVVQLLEEPDLRAQLIERGTERLKHYSWSASAEQLLNVINYLL